LPESFVDPDGRPVNAVRGFTDMVASLITKHEPSRLAVCLDLDWRPQFRVDAVPTYKAHRVEEGSDGASEEVPD
ncbi:flap endonuclease, partial [Gordonia alkanivorans]|nr:flap endonuclease [Gordonia alkanivorans]